MPPRRDNSDPDFETSRPSMMGLAYRMTGSVAEAEDIVQDAWLRWHGAPRRGINCPKSYLMQTVARLCLDRAKSARVRREAYVGPWLPEPVVDHEMLAVTPQPDAAAELASDLSVALLLVLETLAPAERAAFLLHDVFGVPFDEIAAALERTPESCRQLASRARVKVREKRTGQPVPAAEQRRYFEGFFSALRTGDVATLTALLAEEAVLVTDGGGRRTAALNPILGKWKILRFFLGLAAKRGAPRPEQMRAMRLNGNDALVIDDPDGGVQTWSLDWTAAGQVSAIYLLRNPDKLGRVLSAREHPAGSE